MNQEKAVVHEIHEWVLAGICAAPPHPSHSLGTSLRLSCAPVALVAARRIGVGWYIAIGDDSQSSQKTRNSVNRQSEQRMLTNGFRRNFAQGAKAHKNSNKYHDSDFHLAGELLHTSKILTYLVTFVPLRVIGLSQYPCKNRFVDEKRFLA